MSTVNSFSANTTIESSAMNANFTDIASEITNSLPRDGQAAMTGQMKASSGTAAAPSMTFGADTDTGFYRKSANTIGVSAGGVEVGTIDSTGFSSFPTGTVMLFVQTAAPTGWTKSTTHNDKALRVVSGTASTGGTTAFSSVLTSRTIAQGNLPNINLSLASLTGTAAAQTLNNASNLVSGTVGATNTDFNSGFSALPSTGMSNVAVTANASSVTFGGTLPLGGSGTAMDFAVQYVDVILATKD